MIEPASGLPALFGLVFALGMRHGLDPDHLATIDSMTRAGASRRPPHDARWARWTGCLFSLGHGAVVTLVAAVIGVYSMQWEVPGWLDSFGAWISIAVLGLLGWMNVHAAVNTPVGEPVRAAGLKGRVFGRLARSSHPGLVVLVGSLFAVSFDTMSQTAVFALAASTSSGWMMAALLGLVFTAGMMATDGLNGWLMAGMSGRADGFAIVSSRGISLLIGGVSLLVAGIGALRQFSPAIDRVVAAQLPWLGLTLFMLALCGFALAWRRARRAHRMGAI